jgi:hypothetical protein
MDGCAERDGRRTKREESYYYDDDGRGRRDQVEQPYAGRVPWDGVTAEPLWRRCPRRFVAGLLIARLLAASTHLTHCHTGMRGREREREAGVGWLSV